ncbi:hypothetical protein Q7P35_012587 [Cladosporium inversicolor]
MPARTHLPSPAQSQPSSYPVYTESPLRTVQLQSEVRTSRRRAPRSGASDNTSRRNNGSILQNTIYDALGSSEPVDLLPHISKRAAPLHRGRSDTSLDESESPTPPATGDETPDVDPINSAQPPIQEEQRDSMSPDSGEWVLDKVLYATPPGRGDHHAIMVWQHPKSHVLQGGMTQIDGNSIEMHAQHRDT